MRAISRWYERRVTLRRAPLFTLWVASFGCLSIILVAPANAGALNQTEFFHIRPEPLRHALIDLGRQANVQVIVRDNSENNVQFTGIVGRYTVQQAIEIMLKGTDLAYAASGRTLEFFPRSTEADHGVPRTVGRRSPYDAVRSNYSKQSAAG